MFGYVLVGFVLFSMCLLFVVGVTGVGWGATKVVLHFVCVFAVFFFSKVTKHERLRVIL